MLKKYRIYILILIIVIISVLYYLINNRKTTTIQTDNIIKKEINNKSQEEKVVKEIQVDIKGAILNPGVYIVNENDRVKNVIDLAGGLNKYADTSYINLSKKITDEMVIIINTKKEITEYKNKISVIPKILEELGINTNNDVLITDKDLVITNNANSIDNTSTKISINKGDINALQNLPGIGEGKAMDIINYRNNNGLFITIEDIKKVSGIGEATFAKIKDYITL